MFTNYDKEKTYLVACSGGPDSMALLNMLINENFHVIVAHVNYKTRNESDSEEALVKDYCIKHNVECHVAYFDHQYKESFEAAARKFRYHFFAEIYFLKNCSGLFVAHHKDDLIETYLLKKERNVINQSYLIQETTQINKMNVYRPLLNIYYKDDLLKYCQENQIFYGIDVTNFMDIHPRNVIRKKLKNMDKNEVYKEAVKEESKLIDTRKNVKEFLRFYPIYTCDLLKDKDDFWLMIFLYESCLTKYKKYINKSVLLKLKDFLASEKPNLNFLIKDNYYLEKSYGKISYCFINDEEFSYVLNKLEYISTPHFKLVKEGLKMQGVYVKEEDFPLTIRNYRPTDSISLKKGTKKISRLFIDKKVPLLERKSIPVIENKNHEIIFVYKLYRKYELRYVKNNLFMLK